MKQIGTSADFTYFPVILNLSHSICTVQVGILKLCWRRAHGKGAVVRQFEMNSHMTDFSRPCSQIVSLGLAIPGAAEGNWFCHEDRVDRAFLCVNLGEGRLVERKDFGFLAALGMTGGGVWDRDNGVGSLHVAVPGGLRPGREELIRLNAGVSLRGLGRTGTRSAISGGESRL